MERTSIPDNIPLTQITLSGSTTCESGRTIFNHKAIFKTLSFYQLTVNNTFFVSVQLIRCLLHTAVKPRLADAVTRPFLNSRFKLGVNTRDHWAFRLRFEIWGSPCPFSIVRETSTDVKHWGITFLENFKKLIFWRQPRGTRNVNQ